MHFKLDVNDLKMLGIGMDILCTLLGRQSHLSEAALRSFLHLFVEGREREGEITTYEQLAEVGHSMSDFAFSMFKRIDNLLEHMDKELLPPSGEAIH